MSRLTVLEKKVNNLRDKKIRLKGQFESVVAQLKESGFKGIKEVETELSSLKKERKRLELKFEKGLSDLEDKYEQYLEEL
jgi:hypothetical protein